MDEFFCEFSDLADKLTSHYSFLLLFNLMLAASWLAFGTDTANIYISIVTAEMVLLAAGASRRGQKALHLKLDEILRKGDTDDKFIGIERKPEKYIDAEGRSGISSVS